MDFPPHSSRFVFSGIIIKEDNGYSGLCPDVDVASDGDTIEEAKHNLMEAVNLYIDSALDNNIPILRPVPNDENPIYTGKHIVETL